MKPPSNQLVDAVCDRLLDNVDRGTCPPPRKRRNHSFETPAAQAENDVEALNEDVEALEVALASVQRRFHERIAEKKRHLNSLLPVYRLPEELLVKIFAMILRDDAYLPCRHRERVSKVCNAWHGLIKTAPSLWSIISISEGLKRAKLALQMSKNSLLTVKLAFTSNRCAGVDLVQELVPHIGRVDSLTAEIGSEVDIARLIQEPAPALEVLRLQLDRTRAGHLPPLAEIFCGKAGRLRHIMLHGVPIAWDSVTLRRLKSLHLTAIGNTSTAAGPRMGQMIHILGQCPELVHLTLNRVVFSPDDSSDDDAKVQLPHLTSLWIFELAAVNMVRLLASLLVPSCRELRIDCCHQRSLPDIPLQAIKHLIPAIASVLKSTPRVWLAIGASTFSLTTTKATPRFPLHHLEGRVATEYVGIKFPVGLGGEVAAWVRYLLRRSEATQCEVIVKFDKGFTFGEAFRQLEDRNIIEIEVHDSLDADLLLRHLADSPAKASKGIGHSAWSFPKLRHLSIPGYFEAEMMREMIRSRYEQNPATDERSEEVMKPLPLVSLDLGQSLSIDEYDFEEIVALIGEGVAEWEMPVDQDEVGDGDYYDPDWDYDGGYGFDLYDYP